MKFKIDCELPCAKSIIGRLDAPLTIPQVTMPIGIVMARFNLKKAFAVGEFLQTAGILAPFCSGYFSLLLTRVCFIIDTAIVTPLAIAITI